MTLAYLKEARAKLVAGEPPREVLFWSFRHGEAHDALDAIACPGAWAVDKLWLHAQTTKADVDALAWIRAVRSIGADEATKTLDDALRKMSAEEALALVDKAIAKLKRNAG